MAAAALVGTEAGKGVAGAAVVLAAAAVGRAATPAGVGVGVRLRLPLAGSAWRFEIVRRAKAIRINGGNALEDFSSTRLLPVPAYLSRRVDDSNTGF